MLLAPPSFVARREGQNCPCGNLGQRAFVAYKRSLGAFGASGSTAAPPGEPRPPQPHLRRGRGRLRCPVRRTRATQHEPRSTAEVQRRRGGSLANLDRVIGVMLLCAHPTYAVYVTKWTFMCPLCGSKMGLWGLFWVNFVVVGAMKFPVGVVSAREGLEMLDMGYARVCWCCSETFCFAGPRFSAFGTFLPQARGFYVGLCGCFHGGLLRVFTWVTLSAGAKSGRRGQEWSR